MRSVLAHLHYMPDTWKGNAHTYRVRDEFALLFQYKAVSISWFFLLSLIIINFCVINHHVGTKEVKFSFLFKVYLVEELLSPLTTPSMLIFKIRHKSLEIVDFFRNFTVEVTGVGDVCSFAQMDVRRHGNPGVRTVYLIRWNSQWSIILTH